jgi:hypothetical protein
VDMYSSALYQEWQPYVVMEPCIVEYQAAAVHDTEQRSNDPRPVDICDDSTRESGVT